VEDHPGHPEEAAEYLCFYKRGHDKTRTVAIADTDSRTELFLQYSG